MPDFLDRMARASATRVKEGLASESLAQLRRRAASTASPPSLTPHVSGFDLIAEIKLRTPSDALRSTVISTLDEIGARAAAYVQAGAASVSVLTEPTLFSGQLAHLAAASRVSRVPTMRKDFLVHPYQLFEARANGAGGALLILRMLDDALLGEMIDAARETGLFVLLEAFDQRDLARAAMIIDRVRARSSGPLTLVGLNCRDLRTFEMDRSKFAAASDLFPAGTARVAESGIETPRDVAQVAAHGYRMALVGGALMRSADPSSVVRELIAAGRAARRGLGGASCTSS